MRKTGRDNTTADRVPLDRVRAIADRPAPAAYGTVGGSGKRAKRSSVYKQGAVVLAGGENLPVVIRNLSASGCRVEYFQNRRLEGRVLVTEPSLPLRRWGEVVWQGEGVCGIGFSDEAGEE